MLVVNLTSKQYLKNNLAEIFRASTCTIEQNQESKCIQVVKIAEIQCFGNGIKSNFP